MITHNIYHLQIRECQKLLGARVLETFRDKYIILLLKTGVISLLFQFK